MSRNTVISKVFEILGFLLRLDRHRMIVFLEHEEGFQIAEVYQLTNEVGSKASNIVDIISVYYPTYLESYLTHILMNARIWHNSQNEVHLDIIEKVMTTLEKNPLVVSSGRIIDIFLNCIGTYVSIYGDYSSIINKLVEIVRFTVSHNVTKENLSILMDYANVGYMKGIVKKGYIWQLYYTLEIIFELYLKHNKEFMEIVKEEISTEFDSKILSVLLCLLYFFLSLSDLENPGSKVKASNKLSNEEEIKHSETIEEVKQEPHTSKLVSKKDEVLALALFIVVSFNWRQFGDVISKLQKEAKRRRDEKIDFYPKKSDVLPRYDLILFIIEQFDLKETSKQVSYRKETGYQLLATMLGNSRYQKNSIGLPIYHTLIAAVFNKPEMIAGPFFNKSNKILTQAKADQVIKSPLVLEFLVNIFSTCLTPTVRNQFIDDVLKYINDNSSTFAKELVDLPVILSAIFGLSNFVDDERIIEIHTKLWSFMKLETQIINAINGLCYNPAYKLKLVNRILAYELKNRNAEGGKFSQFLTFKNTALIYILEDIVISDHMILRDKKFVDAFGALLILLDKADLLYITSPCLTLFDDRNITKEEDVSSDKGSENIMKFREGGILRILLKLTFLLIKNDTNDKMGMYIFLQYLILRHKSDLKKIKDLIGYKCLVQAVPGVKSTKVRKEVYSLVDLYIRKDSYSAKQHENASASYWRNVILNERSILDPRKIGKWPKQYSREKCIYEQGSLLFMHIFCEIMHILHFRLFKIESYEQLPKGEELQTFINSCKEKLSDAASNCAGLVQLLSDIITQDKDDQLTIVLTAAFDKLIISMKGQAFLAVQNSWLFSMYSILDTKILIKKETDPSSTTNSSKEESIKPALPELENSIMRCDPPESIMKVDLKIIDEFKIKWADFIKPFINEIKKNASNEELASMILDRISNSSYLNGIHGNLLWLTTHNFYRLDKMLLKEVLNSKNRKHDDPSKEQDNSKFKMNLLTRIEDKIKNIKVCKEKAERDAFNKHFLSLARSQYKKLEKEEDQEVGAWFNKKEDKRYKQMFKYIQKEYNKFLKKCPLHTHFAKYERAIKNNFNEFVALSKTRDRLNRAMNLKRYKFKEDDKFFNINYSYMRARVLKKFMLSSLCKEKQGVNELFKEDFKYKPLKNMYSNAAAKWNPPRKENLIKLNKDEEKDKDVCASPGATNEGSLNSNNSDNSSTKSGKASPKKGNEVQYVPESNNSIRFVGERTYHVDMITIKGALYGLLRISTACLSFSSARRPEQAASSESAHPRSESSPILITPLPFDCIEYYNYSKKWAIKDIKEVVVKRYCLIRVAVEIYFRNKKSVFIKFSCKNSLRKFLSKIERISIKRSLKINVVKEPSEFIQNSSYTKRWINGNMSNFEYLMILNKYGGRSFHDINQYPVFPWIIQNYTDEFLMLDQEKIYRPLDVTIAGISPEKRKNADAKLSMTSYEDDKGANPYQFGTHYLPGRVILGYMFRTEPYSTQAFKFDNGHDDPQRLFCSMRNTWELLLNDCADNRELIPEFYYFPEMFGNYNMYSYGSTKFKDNTIRNFEEQKLIKVDQVILPQWAKNNHVFVQLNSRALESKYVSDNLDKWIDMIFGVKQQDPKSFNQFKRLCDEKNVNKMKMLHEGQISEICQLGVNPIQLFTEKHPKRDDEIIRGKTDLSIFSSNLVGDNRKFALIKAKQFPDSAINYIKSYKDKVLIITNDAKIYHSREEYINLAHEETLNFKSKGVSLFPYKKLYNDKSKSFNCDAQRAFVFFNNGNSVITCRYHDNSFKISNTHTGEIQKQVFFHKAFVNVMHLSKEERYLLTASADGAVAVWELSSHFKQPLWHSFDHTKAISSIDFCDQMNIVASASEDGTISLRNVSTGKLLRLIRPKILQSEIPLVISHLRLSPRGYIIGIVKCKESKKRKRDFIVVLTINGEEVYEKQIEDNIYSLILDESGYTFVTGSRLGMLMKHNVTTSEDSFMFEDLDDKQTNFEKVLEEFVNENSVTSLDLTIQEGCQQLLIGTSSGALYTYKFSPRLLGSKYFKTL